jgi:tetratricopeptide (TPR) repeat protein
LNYRLRVGDLLTFGFGPRRGLRRAVAAATWYEQGCALERSDPEAAMAAYERAIAGRGDFADAYNNLGRLHHDRGELDRAEACYRLAICGDAEGALYWFNLGVVVEDRGRFAEAIAAYERAVAIGGPGSSGSGDPHYNLARLLEQIGRRIGDAELMRGAVRHLLAYRATTGTAVRRAR